MFYVGGTVGMRNMGSYAAGTTYFPNGNAALGTVTRSQAAIYPMGGQSSSTTAVFPTFDASASVVLTADQANVLVIPPFSTYVFELKVLARRPGTTQCQGWVYTGMVYRQGSSDVAALAGSVTQLAGWSTGTTLGTPQFNPSGNHLGFSITPSAATLTFYTGVLIVAEMTTSS